MNTMSQWLFFQLDLERRIEAAEQDKEGSDPAMKRVSPPGLSMVGMVKSELLGRLVRGEEIRTRPCQKHKGKMWCSWGGHADMECCDGTGWLRNEKEKPNPFIPWKQ